MHNEGKIIWLASYPKSGNTWFRVFLTNLLAKNGEEVNINELQQTTIASSRKLFDDYAGISSSLLSFEEIEQLRPNVYDCIAAEAESLLYLKIHDAFIYTKEGRPLVSEKATYKVVYIIRNPLDVAVSFAHHLVVTNNKAVEFMNSHKFSFCNHTNKLDLQLEQRLLNWSEHVLSWTNQSLFPVHILRYEDMIAQPFETFKKATEFCEIEATDMEIAKAIENSSFENLQKQEKEVGFKEKPPKAASFFRKGKAGSWKEELTNDLAQMIVEKHKKVMQLYNYLP